MKPQEVALLNCLVARPMTTGAIRAACGISSPGAVVYDLRGHGIRIDTELVQVPTRRGRATVARYRLRPESAPKARRLLRQERVAA